jgi:hypothetical protein
MGIKPNFTQADIDRRLSNFLEVVELRILKRLQYLGEMCVTHARNNGSYLNQTGNLRSSIGYVIFKDGVAIKENYEVVKGGSEGAIKGKILAQKVGAKYKEGYTLVVTAGMNYAAAVESRGKDVLASSEIIAKQYLPIMLKQLKSNVKTALEL